MSKRHLRMQFRRYLATFAFDVIEHSDGILWF